MQDTFGKLFDFLALFVGGRGVENDAVQFGMGSLLWGVLFLLARVRLRSRRDFSGRLLCQGFLFGLCRELFMLAVSACAYFGVVSRSELERVFPPLEHAVFDLAAVFIVGAFANLYTEDEQRTRRYLVFASIMVVGCYLVTFAWWYRAVSQHPTLRFGMTWCDWLFHGNAVLVLGLPLASLLVRGLRQGERFGRRLTATMGDRPSMRLLFFAPLFLFPLSRGIKLFDLWFEERYSFALAPLEHAAYLLAVFLLAGFYIRRVYAERGQAIAELSSLTASLERIVAQRTAELEAAKADLEDKVRERTRQIEEMQRQVLHAEKLRAVGSLASSIVHEFGTPIFAIRNLLENFRDTGELAAGQRELVDLAVAECRRLSRLLDNLRDFHRPRSAPPQRLAITTLLDEVLAIYRGRFARKGIVVVTEYAPDLPPVMVVRDQIKQVIFNLLANAEEAMAGPGTITVRTGRDDRFVTFSIGDSGPGVAEDLRDTLFEPFVSSKAAASGTGLGLSISYGIIRRHQGRISYESVPGKGSIFTVHLPLVLKHAGRGGRV